MAALIELKDITKEYNGNVVLRGIDLVIEQNEFVTFLGPSGCGKTTTLRIIGGFINPTSGEVLFDGKDILSVPAHKRPTNTVFQRYALFPHLDVFENVAFGLRIKGYGNRVINQEIKKVTDKYNKLIDNAKTSEETNKLKIELKRKIDIIKNPNILKKEKIKELKKESLIEINSAESKEEIKEIKQELKSKTKKIKESLIKRSEQLIKDKVNKYLTMVGLTGYENRSVDLLSGGQQQRVAIARALINEPKVLLLDEPLAALDLKLRQEMQYELKEIQKNAGITFIFVTHDQEEALIMSDKIVVMNNGEIQQIGTPVDIYNEPINTFVANFIGESNILEGIMKDDYLVSFDGKDYECVDRGFARNEVVDIVIRPEDIDIVKKGDGKLTGVVDSIAFKGVHYEIDVKTKKRIYTIHTTDHSKVGTEVDIDFSAEDIHVMEKW